MASDCIARTLLPATCNVSRQKIRSAGFKCSDFFSRQTRKLRELECDRCFDVPAIPDIIALASDLAGFLLVAGSTAAAQEPAAGLKQADTASREGLAALNQNDLQTAQSKFEDVARLAPSLEQGHSALGAVLVREGRLEPGSHAKSANNY